jgi:hypothetical protein
LFSVIFVVGDPEGKIELFGDSGSEVAKKGEVDDWITLRLGFC